MTVQPHEPAPDPRSVRPGICGATRTLAGHLFVCVADPHDTPARQWRRDPPAGWHPKSERHYYVRANRGGDT